jgi:hypothetical protein
VLDALRDLGALLARLAAVGLVKAGGKQCAGSARVVVLRALHVIGLAGEGGQPGAAPCPASLSWP